MEIDESFFWKIDGKLDHLRILAPKIFHGFVLIMAGKDYNPCIPWLYESLPDFLSFLFHNGKPSTKPKEHGWIMDL